MNQHAQDIQPGALRPLPHNIEAEQALLGAILVNNRALDRCTNLRAEDFFDPVHAVLFDVMRGQYAQNESVNAVTLKSFSDAMPQITERLSVFDYVKRLVSAGDTSNVSGLVNVVLEMSKRRSLIMVANELVSSAHDIAAPDEAIEQAESALYSLRDRGSNSRRVVSIHSAMVEALDATEAAYKRGTGLCGISTGITMLDDVLAGLAPSGLYVLAGRPGMGKSALAVNVAFNAAEAGTPVGMLSLEMSSMELGQRVLAERSGVPGWALRKGDIRSDAQWHSLIKTIDAQKSVPFYIDQSGGITTAQMAMKARRMASKYKLGLLVVDYLQLVNGSKNTGNRVQEVTEITVTLKALAKELGIPVLALSQLSRNVEHRDNKRPMLADLRESGSIEQDADCVMFVYREAYYLERAKPEEGNKEFTVWQADMARKSGLSEVIVAKNRHGPLGTAELAFDANTMTFRNKD